MPSQVESATAILINLFSQINSDEISLFTIGNYFPEVRAFGTLITSTKVFRLIICKTYFTTPH